MAIYLSHVNTSSIEVSEKQSVHVRIKFQHGSYSQQWREKCEVHSMLFYKGRFLFQIGQYPFKQMFSIPHKK